jgi:hypothetical protein
MALTRSINTGIAACVGALIVLAYVWPSQFVECTPKAKVWHIAGGLW